MSDVWWCVEYGLGGLDVDWNLSSEGATISVWTLPHGSSFNQQLSVQGSSRSVSPVRPRSIPPRRIILRERNAGRYFLFHPSTFDEPEQTQKPLR